MLRGLERRLRAAETYQFGSERVAAILRATHTMSDQELMKQITEPSGILNPRTMIDEELGQSIAELERLSAQSEALSAEPIASNEGGLSESSKNLAAPGTVGVWSSEI
jgi:hypothetical protein